MEERRLGKSVRLPPKVAIIVLAWNGKALTLSCLSSLAKLDYENTTIILVDNASTDGTVEAVRESFGESIRIIENIANLGFSRGNNVGIEAALKDGADYILLLNNDTIVDEKLATHLVDAMLRHPGVGIAGPKIYYHGAPDVIWSAGGEVSLWRRSATHRGIRERDLGQYDDTREVDYVTGCALMAARDVFARIGMLDPSFKAYFEDTDFCMRARHAGYRILYIPQGKVWHKISQSTGGQISFRKIALKLLSTFRFCRRYARPYHWLAIPFFFFLDVLRIIFLIAVGKIRNTGEATV